MRRLFTLIVCCSLVGCGKPERSAIPADPRLGVPSLLRPGTITADVMMPGTRRTADISARMAKAIQANPDWWTAYAKANIKEGQVLPYHANMGIRQSEWDEICRSTAKGTMTKIGTASLRIEMLGQDRIGMSATLPHCVFDQIVFDLASNRVETAYGITTGFVFAASSATAGRRGWPRYEWSCVEMSAGFLDDINRASCRAAMIAVGLDRQTDKTVLWYQGKRIESGRMLQRTDAFLMF